MRRARLRENCSMSTVPILAGIGGEAFCSVVLTGRGSRAGVCCRVSFRPISCDGARTLGFIWVSSVDDQFCGTLVTNGLLICDLLVNVSQDFQRLYVLLVAQAYFAHI